mgnify:CR=1 FL=1
MGEESLFMVLPENWNDMDITEEIGSGAYGKVYEAVDSSGNRFTVKVISVPNENEIGLIKEKYGDEYEEACMEILQKIIKEIEIMRSAKDQDNIVKCLDYQVISKNDGFIIYIKMPRLTSLYDYLICRGVSEKTVAKIGIDICGALEFCHEKKILHRDIKPSNILVNDGVFMLSDFGLVSDLSAGIKRDVQGTYAFMAPEIYNVENYNELVDEYSLGLTLYYLLNNNRVPFADTDKQILSQEDVENAIIERMEGKRDITPPINCGPELSEIILKACAYKADDRYKDISDLKNALIRFLKDKDKRKTGETTGETKRHILKRNHKLSKLSFILLVIVIAEASVTLKLIYENKKNESEAKAMYIYSSKNIGGAYKTEFTDEKRENAKELISESLKSSMFEDESYTEPIVYEIGEKENYILEEAVRCITLNNDYYSYISNNYIYLITEDGDELKFSDDKEIINEIISENYPKEAKEAIKAGREFVDFSSFDYVNKEKDTVPTGDYTWTNEDLYIPDLISANVYLSWKNDDGTVSFFINMKNGTADIRKFDLNMLLVNDETVIAKISSKDMSNTFVSPRSSLNAIVTVPLINDAPIKDAYIKDV